MILTIMEPLPAGFPLAKINGLWSFLLDTIYWTIKKKKTQRTGMKMDTEYLNSGLFYIKIETEQGDFSPFILNLIYSSPSCPSSVEWLTI